MNRYQREQRLERLAQCPEGHDTRHFYGWLDEIDKLQAEANRNMKELCEARGERDKLKEKVAYLQEECDEWPLAHEAARNAKKVLNG